MLDRHPPRSDTKRSSSSAELRCSASDHVDGAAPELLVQRLAVGGQRAHDLGGAQSAEASEGRC